MTPSLVTALRRSWSTALLVALAATPAHAQPAADPLPGGRKGVLTVTVTTTGTLHRSNTKKERQDWTILRKAEYRTPLVALMSSSVDLMADRTGGDAPPPAPRVTVSQAQMLERLQKALRNCPQDDQKCLMDAAQRIAASADGLPAAPPDAAAPDMDFTRYQTWQADRQGGVACAAGTASVHETMGGNGLSDNSGAMWAIEGFRNGEVELPNTSWSHSCDTAIGFDRKAGTYTLRIGALNIGVPSELAIQRKGMPASVSKSRASLAVLEYTDVPLKDYGLTLRNQKGTPESVAGSATFPGVAPSETRSVGTTTTVVPQVKTTIAWHLTLE